MRTALLAIAALALGHVVAWAQPASTTAATVPTPSQRVALVTGSTDGLGREVARRLAAEGAHVIVHGRNAERGKAMVDEITAAGKGSARFYQADFASLAEVRSLADAITRDYPRLDLLVNNAGVVVRRRTRGQQGRLRAALRRELPLRLPPHLQAPATHREGTVAAHRQRVVAERRADRLHRRDDRARLLHAIAATARASSRR